MAWLGGNPESRVRARKQRAQTNIDGLLMPGMQSSYASRKDDEMKCNERGHQTSKSTRHLHCQEIMLVRYFLEPANRI